MKYLPIILALMLASGIAIAHSGRTDANGCHIDHQTGVRHCH